MSAVKKRVKRHSGSTLSQLAEVIKNESVQKILTVLKDERGFADLHEELKESISDSNLAKILQRCIELNLVERDPPYGRGRNVKYKITENGKKALEVTEKIKENENIYKFLRNEITAQEFEIGIPILVALRKKWSFEKERREREKQEPPTSSKDEIKLRSSPSVDSRQRVDHRWLREAVPRVVGPNNLEEVKRILENSPPSYYNVFQKLTESGYINVGADMKPHLGEEENVDILLKNLGEFIGSPYNEGLVKEYGEIILEKLKDHCSELIGEGEFRGWFLLSDFEGRSITVGGKELGYITAQLFDTFSEISRLACSESLKNIRIYLTKQALKMVYGGEDSIKLLEKRAKHEKESFLLEIHPVLEKIYLVTLLYNYPPHAPYPYIPFKFQKSKVILLPPDINSWEGQQESLWRQAIQEINKVSKFIGFTPEHMVITMQCEEHSIIAFPKSDSPLIIVTSNPPPKTPFEGEIKYALEDFEKRVKEASKETIEKEIIDEEEEIALRGGTIEKEKTCPKCGTKNDADSNYCKKCGTKLRLSHNSVGFF